MVLTEEQGVRARFANERSMAREGGSDPCLATLHANDGNRFRVSTRAWLLPAAVTVGWLAGFLVPGVPAGLGVREAALTAMLGPSLGVGLVISAAALWRLSHMIADLLMFGLGLSLRDRVPGRSSSEP
jgi:hypothetical protein